MKQTGAVAEDDRNQGRQRAEKTDLLARLRDRIHGKPAGSKSERRERERRMGGGNSGEGPTADDDEGAGLPHPQPGELDGPPAD